VNKFCVTPGVGKLAFASIPLTQKSSSNHRSQERFFFFLISWPTSRNEFLLSFRGATRRNGGKAMAVNGASTDVIVIGAGPIGLFAVCQLGLAKLKAHAFMRLR
jgi:hypothetical protein